MFFMFIIGFKYYSGCYFLNKNSIYYVVTLNNFILLCELFKINLIDLH